MEEKQDDLQRFFNPELQHNFRLLAARRIITGTPIFLLLVAFTALFLAVFAPEFVVTEAAWRFAAYLAWTSCLGGVGAISFLAMNSLAIQNDATFDMSDGPRGDAHRAGGAVRVHRLAAVLLPLLQEVHHLGAHRRRP